MVAGMPARLADIIPPPFPEPLETLMLSCPCISQALRLQVAVTESLLDRLEDCKRTFPTVAVLGGAGSGAMLLVVTHLGFWQFCAYN